MKLYIRNKTGRCGLTMIGLLLLFFFNYLNQVYAGQVVVTSLPYTISQSSHSGSAVDTVTLQGTKLSSTGSGLKLVCAYHDPLDGWYVNLGTDTIVFATSGGNNNYGLQIDQYGTGYYSSNVVVEGGTIICNPPSRSDSTVCKNATCIVIAGQDILIKDVNTVADGFNGKCVNGESQYGYDIEIDGGTHTSLVTHFTSRCQFDAAAMKFWTEGWDSSVANAQGYTCNARIHNVRIVGVPHLGIRVDGGAGAAWGVFKVYDCNINIDARNYVYTSYVGTCASCANAYGIATQYLGPGSEIYGDTITSGTTYGGGRGILCEQLIGTASIPVLIHDNYINVHEGPNAEYGEADADVHGLRIRYSCQYVNVYNNTIYATGDNNVSTASYSKSVMGLRYSFGGEGQDAGLTQAHVTIENNHFRAKSLNSGSTCVAACFDDCIVQDTTFIFRHNYLESDGIIVRWAEYNNAARYITMVGDTFSFLSPSYDPMTFYVGYSGMSTWESNHNFVRDAVYLNGAAYDDINFSSAGISDLTIQKTLDILVVGNNSLPVNDAIVWAKNNYGNEFFRDTTGTNGHAGKPVSILYDVRSGTDSTGYNPYTIWAKKGSDSASVSQTVSATSANPAVTLTQTSGEEVIDSIAPSRINNLGALPGDNAGEVRLSWTAPGNDSTSGTAAQYDIRYSLSNITESNWNYATAVAGETAPKSSGSAEAFLVTGLQSEKTYYFAVKTADEIPNWSDLSNIISITTSEELAPGQIDNLVASAGSNSGEVSLAWTAPGDDGTTGTASQYDIRYSLSNITESNWDYATAVTGETAPKLSGSDETFLVTSLQPEKTYYFGIKTADDLSNWSDLSNIASIMTPDKLAPGPITNLAAASGFNAGEILLSWTAPGDDGEVGTASSYAIRYSISTITESNWNAATSYTGSIPPPSDAGESQSLLLTGLTPGRTFYLAMRTYDNAENLSALSNITFAKAQSGITLGEDIIVAGISPEGGAMLNTCRPTFKVQNIDTASTNYYFFEIATDIDFVAPVSSSSAIAQAPGDETSWRTEERLSPRTVYYWRARANDYSFNEAVSFQVATEPHVYPNPFRPASGRTATFTGIPDGSKLTLMSVSGASVKSWASATGEDIIWDGSNESGNPVASGTYLWFVEGTDISGKLVIIR